MINLKNYTLLVVDDDEDLRDIMQSTFKRDGFTVLSAGSSADAFELVQRNKIDLVVSDMRMPGGDGLSLLKKIRAYNPDIPPVIFVTGFADVSVAECLASGAKGVIAKPFNHKDLLKSVKTSLNILAS